MTATVDLKAAFGTDDATQVAVRLEAYKAALDSAPSTATGWVPALDGFEAPANPLADLGKAADALVAATLNKGASAEVAASLQAQIQAAQADLVKDFTLTSPLATGYVAYDLEAPSA